jgi:hypothetical protein
MSTNHGAVALVVLLAAGCSSLPPSAIAVGDTCTRCSRRIRDTRIASEIIDSSGRAFKFDKTGCLAAHLVEKTPDAAAIYVTDNATGRLVKASAVQFVRMPITDGREQSLDYVAFYSSSAAAAAAQREKTTPIEWTQLLEEARSSGGRD